MENVFEGAVEVLSLDEYDLHRGVSKSWLLPGQRCNQLPRGIALWPLTVHEFRLVMRSHQTKMENMQPIIHTCSTKVGLHGIGKLASLSEIFCGIRESICLPRGMTSQSLVPV